MKPTVQRATLLDTTVQIDRIKMGGRDEFLEGLLQLREWTISTGVSLLEFKAVLIRELITIHNQMRRKGARFTRVRDALVEKDWRQHSLRSHIFNNLIGVYGSSHTVTHEEDQILATKARLAIENILPEVYRWFKEDSAHVYLNHTRAKCTRADEAPAKSGRAFQNLPKCKVGKNRFCRVEEFIRESGGPSLLQHIENLLGPEEDRKEEHRQLSKAKDILERVINDANTRLSVDDCRGAGDCLIALEGSGVATEVLSTNAKEWAHICGWLGMSFEHIKYPGEETK